MLPMNANVYGYDLVTENSVRIFRLSASHCKYTRIFRLGIESLRLYLKNIPVILFNSAVIVFRVQIIKSVVFFNPHVS